MGKIDIKISVKMERLAEYRKSHYKKWKNKNASQIKTG